MAQSPQPWSAASPRFTRTAAILVVLAWLAVAAVGTLIREPLYNDADGTKMYLPLYLESQHAQAELKEQFPGQYHYSNAVIVFHRPDGLTVKDWRQIRDFIEWIHHPGDDLPADTPDAKRDDVRQYLTEARVQEAYWRAHLAPWLNSADGSTTLVVVGMPDIFTARRTQDVVRALRGRLHEIGLAEHGLRDAADRLSFEITGDAGFYDNYSDAATRSIDRSTFVSVALVTIILLLIYRSPVAMLVPLATIGLAVHVAMRLLYVMSPLGFEANPTIEMFVVVIVFGSGTDFCLFVISRYKEEVRQAPTDVGLSAATIRGQAMVRAMKSTWAAVVASAMTTMAGLSLMALAIFQAFAKSGPSIAVALTVGCAASLTLAPALYLLAGRTLFWFAPRHDAGGGPAQGLWRRLADPVMRHPGWVIMAVLLVVAVPSLHALSVQPTHNIFDELTDDWSSVRGAALLKDHYPAGLLGPATLLIEADQSLDNPAGTDLMRDLAGRIAGVTVDGQPMVADVLWVGRPLGLREPPAVTPPPNDMVAMAGFLAKRQMARSAYLSADGRCGRLEIFLAEGCYTDRSIDAAVEIRRVAAEVAAEQPWIKGTLLAGASSTIADIRDVAHRDFAVISAAVLAAVYLILLVVLRRPVLGLVLIGGTVLSFTAALGIADWVFVDLLGAPGLDWKITFFLLVLLVAVGVDYNIFLCTRIAQEERRRPPAEAVAEALTRTGGIISACGLIVAGTFASMIAGDLSLMIQLGFALAVGILIDTFLIRPLLVPAAALLLSRWRQRRRNPD